MSERYGKIPVGPPTRITVQEDIAQLILELKRDYLSEEFYEKGDHLLLKNGREAYDVAERIIEPFKESITRVTDETFLTNCLKGAGTVFSFNDAFLNASSITHITGSEGYFQGFALHNDKHMIIPENLHMKVVGTQSQGTIINNGKVQELGSESSGLLINNAYATRMANDGSGIAINTGSADEFGSRATGGLYINTGRTDEFLFEARDVISINMGNQGDHGPMNTGFNYHLEEGGNEIKAHVAYKNPVGMNSFGMTYQFRTLYFHSGNLYPTDRHSQLEDYMKRIKEYVEGLKTDVIDANNIHSHDWVKTQHEMSEFRDELAEIVHELNN